ASTDLAGLRHPVDLARRHAGGDRHPQRPGFAHAALARAGDAGREDPRAVPLARAARLGRDQVAEEAAHLRAHVPRSAADVAALRLRARLTARAVARAAQHGRVDLLVVLGAEDHVRQVEPDLDDRVLALLPAVARPPAAAAPTARAA